MVTSSNLHPKRQTNPVQCRHRRPRRSATSKSATTGKRSERMGQALGKTSQAFEDVPLKGHGKEICVAEMYLQFFLARYIKYKTFEMFSQTCDNHVLTTSHTWHTNCDGHKKMPVSGIPLLHDQSCGPLEPESNQHLYKCETGKGGLGGWRSSYTNYEFTETRGSSLTFWNGVKTL